MKKENNFNKTIQYHCVNPFNRKLQSFQIINNIIYAGKIAFKQAKFILNQAFSELFQKKETIPIQGKNVSYDKIDSRNGASSPSNISLTVLF